jgi:hypothetical protein
LSVAAATHHFAVCNIHPISTSVFFFSTGRRDPNALGIVPLTPMRIISKKKEKYHPEHISVHLPSVK